MCGFIAWLGIAISHYRFRKGYLAQGGRLEDLPYRAKLFPFGPLFAFALCMVITLGQNYQALVGERIDWIGLLATYISLPLFLAIWLDTAGRSVHASFATTKWTSARPIPDSPCRPAIPRGSLRMPARFLAIRLPRRPSGRKFPSRACPSRPAWAECAPS